MGERPMIATMLTPEQIQRVQEGSLRLLQEIGVQVPHPDVLSRLQELGARVDWEGQRVRIPPKVVERCLQSCGRQFTLYGRDLERTASFGTGRRNYNSIAGEAHWVEEPGGPRRPARIADVAVACCLGDALEHINIVGAMTDPQDVPVPVRCLHVLLEQLRHTTKPVTFWFHDRASARFLVEMLIALRGDEQRASDLPLTYPLLEPISPLRFPFNGLDLLYEVARLNMPVAVGPMAQMGVSAPCTIAGTLVHQNAEVLAGICVVQAIRSGTPVCYGGICHAFDMRTTQLVFSGPEQAIFGVAMTQLGKDYGLPVYVNTGLTDSKRPDAQAGLEAGATLLLSAAAGADVFGHMGISGVDQATSLDMLVFQDEVISYVESALREVDFSDEALGFEASVEAGIGGSFLALDHTARHLRRELWQPRILDRQYYDPWCSGGARSTEERCRQRRQELLATHQVQPLAEDVDRELAKIVAAAERELLS
jgi:trimethylamine--corrinoid protein Co-methyltransferase